MPPLKLIIDCVHQRAQTPWSIRLLMHEILNLCNSCDEVKFKHIFYEANFTADTLLTLVILYLKRGFGAMNCLFLFYSPFYYK